VNVVEINKYRPPLYRHARYLSQDWTSISDLGQSRDGVELTLDAYLATEERYLRAIHRFMNAAKVERLRVQGLEHWTTDEELDSQIATGLRRRPAPTDGDELHGADLDDAVRRCLRELAWMELAVPSDFLVHIGHDYRLVVATNADTSAAEEATRSDGLFTYPGDRGLATVRAWEEGTEGTLANWAKKGESDDR
jgi:hypothetical protein